MYGATSCLLVLITLAAGYFVLVKANKEAKGLRLLGLAIATLIIGAALLLGTFKLLHCGSYGKYGQKGLKAMMSCPFKSGVRK